MKTNIRPKWVSSYSMFLNGSLILKKIFCYYVRNQLRTNSNHLYPQRGCGGGKLFLLINEKTFIQPNNNLLKTIVSSAYKKKERKRIRNHFVIKLEFKVDWILATNSGFLITISLQPVVEDLCISTMNSVRLNSLSLKHQMFTPSGCKSIWD